PICRAFPKASSCRTRPSDGPGPRPMERRTLLKLTAAGAALIASAQESGAQSSQAGGGFELAEASVADLQASMQSGARTSAAIAQMYLARMDAIDRAGPAINSIIERNPDALAAAEAL